MIVDGHEIGVIYMRCGYHPDQYPTQLEWDARLMMEMSKAIKSPTINYHLAGTKKVQQELAKEGFIEKFLEDEEEIKSVKDIFTGLYSLDKVSGFLHRKIECKENNQDHHLKSSAVIFLYKKVPPRVNGIMGKLQI